MPVDVLVVLKTTGDVTVAVTGTCTVSSTSEVYTAVTEVAAVTVALKFLH